MDNKPDSSDTEFNNKLLFEAYDTFNFSLSGLFFGGAGAHKPQKLRNEWVEKQRALGLRTLAPRQLAGAEQFWPETLALGLRLERSVCQTDCDDGRFQQRSQLLRGVRDLVALSKTLDSGARAWFNAVGDEQCVLPATVAAELDAGLRAHEAECAARTYQLNSRDWQEPLAKAELCERGADRGVTCVYAPALESSAEDALLASPEPLERAGTCALFRGAGSAAELRKKREWECSCRTKLLAVSMERDPQICTAGASNCATDLPNPCTFKTVQEHHDIIGADQVMRYLEEVWKAWPSRYGSLKEAHETLTVLSEAFRYFGAGIPGAYEWRFQHDDEINEFAGPAGNPGGLFYTLTNLLSTLDFFLAPPALDDQGQ